MPSLISIGNSALNAANAGLRTTGQNIANVNTPGYTRQVSVQSPAISQFTGSGYLGNGVDVTTVRRMYDSFLTAQATQATASSAEAAARAAQLDGIDAALGSPDGGIPAAVNKLFGALNTASNDPTSLAARQAVLSAAGVVAAEFNSAASSLADQRLGIEAQLKGSVATVNGQLHDMATINEQIVLAQSTGQPANDLLDKRDALVRSISGLIGVTPVQQDNGMVNLFTGNSQPLVVGGDVSTLELHPGADRSQPTVLGLRIGNSFTALDSSQLSGGSIAGVLKFSDQDLAQAQDEIGRLALATASALNAQHALGSDAQGKAGGPLFNLPASPIGSMRDVASSISVAISDPKALALAMPGAGIGDNRNGLALGDLSSARLVDGMTLSDSFAGLYGKVGSLASTARASADAHAATLNSAKAAEQAVAGVNLDEEAARLIQYQQAYQAAAKLISTAQNVFNTLLDLGR